MGDRGQIAIQQEDGKTRVYLYTHWGGSEIKETLRAALDKGRDRWNDSEYLARIIFQQMIGDDDQTTGFGISTGAHGDVEHHIPVLDCTEKKITWDKGPYAGGNPPDPITFEAFCKAGAKVKA